MSCAACGGRRLGSRWRVAGDPGEQGLIPSTDRFGTALSDIVRCEDCGHMQLAQLESDAQMLSDAASADYLVEEPGQRATARRTLDAIERHTPPGALLDVGCWLGFLLDEARVRGWSTIGVEPSRFASAYAREHLGLDVRTTDLFSAELPQRGLDAVVLADVIEHLADPGAALDRIASSMRLGGVLYLVLPDAGSRVARLLGRRWWSVIPTHLQYFTRGSLLTLLRRHGWEPIEISTAPKAFTVRYYAGRVGGYSRPLGRALVSGVDFLGVGHRLWAPDFRDRMAVVARLS